MNTNNSALLNSLGMGNFDLGYLLILLIVLFILVIVLLVLVIIQGRNTKRLKNRLDRFLLGKNGGSLEGKLVSLSEDYKFIKINVDANKKEIQQVNKRLETVYQKMGLVKYDAFHQMGGQLSFSLALLDEKNNGFIINSVHSTDGCYSYTKEIRRGESSISLGKEEAEALAIAMGEE